MTQSGHGHEGQQWGQPSGGPPNRPPGPPPAQPPAQPPVQPPGQPWGPPPPHQTPHQPQPGGDPATQYLRPVPPHQQSQPPQAHQQPPHQQDPATQYLRPVPPESPAESTQYLGTGYGAQPQSPAGNQGNPGNPDTEATQYIPPVPGNSGPPAEFDNLFRDNASAAPAPGANPGADAAATQYLPPVAAGPPQQPRPGYGYPPPQPYGQQPPRQPYDGYDGHDGYDDEPAPRRRVGKVPMAAAVVVGCALLGLGAGALMNGGGDKGDDKTGNAGVAAPVSPTPGESVAESAEPSPSEEPADPAKEQAEALDTLLAQSGDSRASVISSVENIRKCQELDQAVTDLKAAAAQRRQLVNRLKELDVDQLPDNAALSAALTKAWQASATADDHYAAWATQVKKPKNCKDGEARNTSHTGRAVTASGEATAAKKEAARLWNGIAETYGLTKRQPTQL